jgi:hypothetical protein
MLQHQPTCGKMLLPTLDNPSDHYLKPGFATRMPKGMREEQHELAQACREWMPEVVATLVYWLLSPDSAASLRAAQLLLERGYGKSREQIELLTAQVNTTQTLTLEEKAQCLLRAMESGDATIELPEAPGEELLG